MNVTFTNICNSVIAHCQLSSYDTDENVMNAALEVKEKGGDLQQLAASNPFRMYTPLFIKVMEVAFSKLFDPQISEEDQKIITYFGIKEQGQSPKVEYSEIAPILLKRCVGFTSEENKEEFGFLTRLVNKILCEAAKTLDEDYEVLGGSKVVLYKTKNLSGGGGWEDYGQSYKPYYLEVITNFDQAYCVMATTTIHQLREQAKSKM